MADISKICVGLDVKAYEYCAELAKQCDVQKSDSSFSMTDRNGTLFPFSKQTSCFGFARIHARSVGAKTTSGSAPTAPATTNNANAIPTKPSTDIFSPDKKRNLACPFASADISLEVSSDVQVVSRVLLFPTSDGMRGVKASIAYIVVPSGSGYTLKYKVFEGKAPDGVDKNSLDDSVQFTATGGEINETLAFTTVTQDACDLSNHSRIIIQKVNLDR